MGTDPPARPLAVTGAVLDGETVGVRCEEGAIAAIGPEVRPGPGDETIDAAGAPLVPALVNGHTHAAMTLFRGYGGDLPLMRRLQEKVWPVEAKLEPEDVYWGTRLACVEMIRTGTARFWDMYWQPAAAAPRCSMAATACSSPAPPPTSCCCTATPTRPASATSPPTSSMPPPARSSTPRWSPAGC